MGVFEQIVGFFGNLADDEETRVAVLEQGVLGGIAFLLKPINGKTNTVRHLP